MSRVEVCGIEFDDLSIREAVEKALWLMEEARSVIAVTPNAEIVLEAQRNRALRAVIRSAELVLADGTGVLQASRLQGKPLHHRVPGIDFCSALLARMAELGQRVFLLGGVEGVAEEAGERLSARYPGLVIAGTHNGYFDAEESYELIEQINAAAPDLLIVCLGSPKQEIWMKRCQERLLVGMMIGLGGTLDVYAGRVKRAPERWRSLGLEWLYRLLHEPKRLRRVLRLPAIYALALFRRLVK
ncbi:MAG: WecB/TagA/CpsF family glycosyltransferase [Oscillospiraceae bacterium]|nr:WecB/TagA/CpsF family glycosyltransferase [Oscillospiraceae bacterium]MBQ6465909.1 WecB/TagA/CpsF family glycosyltransferase [Oscillospiraceae bacterium]